MENNNAFVVDKKHIDTVFKKLLKEYKNYNITDFTGFFFRKNIGGMIEPVIFTIPQENRMELTTSYLNMMPEGIIKDNLKLSNYVKLISTTQFPIFVYTNNILNPLFFDKEKGYSDSLSYIYYFDSINIDVLIKTDSSIFEDINVIENDGNKIVCFNNPVEDFVIENTVVEIKTISILDSNYLIYYLFLNKSNKEEREKYITLYQKFLLNTPDYSVDNKEEISKIINALNSSGYYKFSDNTRIYKDFIYKNPKNIKKWTVEKDINNNSNKIEFSVLRTSYKDYDVLLFFRAILI